MGMRKDYYLKEAALALHMLRVVYLHDAVVVKKTLSYTFLKKNVKVSARDLDEIGIRADVDEDVYDFKPGRDPEGATCVDVIDQWKMEALAKIESKEMSVVKLAGRCNLSRQSLYRIVKHNSTGLQHLFTLRGASPILLWRGRPLQVCYDECVADPRAKGLMERVA